MNLTRRTLLVTAAPGALATLAGCAATTNPVTGVTTYNLDPRVLDFIQSAVAAAAQYIPTIESIAQTASSLFGPAYAAIVAAGSAAVNQVVAVLTNIVGQLTPSARGRLRVRLRASGPTSPVYIGVTAGGVTVSGYKV